MPSVNYPRCVFICGACMAIHRTQGFWRWFFAGVRCSCPCRHAGPRIPLADQLTAAGVTDWDGAAAFFEARIAELERPDPDADPLAAWPFLHRPTC